jgi:hypothetical protein
LSPIRHDYKPSAERKTTKKNALPWFAAGLGLPLMGIAVVLLQGRSTEVVAEDEPAAVSIQNFVEIPIGDDSTETAVALEPDVTPELGAGAVDANDQELASATVVTPDISKFFIRRLNWNRNTIGSN